MHDLRTMHRRNQDAVRLDRAWRDRANRIDAEVARRVTERHDIEVSSTEDSQPLGEAPSNRTTSP